MIGGSCSFSWGWKISVLTVQSVPSCKTCPQPWAHPSGSTGTCALCRSSPHSNPAERWDSKLPNFWDRCLFSCASRSWSFEDAKRKIPGFGDSEWFRRLGAAIWGLSHRWLLRGAGKFPRHHSPRTTQALFSAGGRQVEQMRALKLEIPFLAWDFCSQWFDWS